MAGYGEQRRKAVTNDMIELLTPQEVEDMTGLSWKMRDKLERQGRFPEKLKLGHRTVRYYADEIDQWLMDPRGYQRDDAA